MGLIKSLLLRTFVVSLLLQIDESVAQSVPELTAATNLNHTTTAARYFAGVRNGVVIQPAHVHKALRRYLGIHDNAISSQFPFNNTEDFDFFG